jgi:hypothetical protein
MRRLRSAGKIAIENVNGLYEQREVKNDYFKKEPYK